MKIVILGLSLSSSWGNGHATTWRAIAKGLAQLNCETLFLERRQPWYCANQDLSNPWYCKLAFYDDVQELQTLWRAQIAEADLVLIGSFVPDGVAVIDIALAHARGPVCFYDIDTPVTLAALRAGRETYIAPRQIRQIHAYLSFTGGPNLRVLRERFGARRAEALYCCADPDIYRPTGNSPRWDLGYLGTYSDDRQPMLERLLIEPARRLPQRRFVVAGPQYPSSIEWPENVERIEHLAPCDHPAFYSRQRFTLNVTRADMVAAGWSPSVRLFEAACCASPIISDPWPGLDEVFRPESEIFIRDSSNAVVDLIERGDGRDAGERARRRALRDHTGLNRARKILSLLRNDTEARSAEPAGPAHGAAIAQARP
ncbi:MAG: glycosyltransferase [Beijerinckiaceae bacterium]|nr:glycosyltransferase [Beijerinckiaceae bacterium]